MKKLQPLLALGLGLALAFVIACGGDKDSGSGTVAGPIDLASTASKLEELKSFRFDMTMKLDVPMGTGGSEDDAFGAALLGLFGDIRAEGAFVAPDNMQVTMSMAGQEFGIVQIGADAWTKFGTSKWEKTTAAAAGIDIGSSPTELITEFLPQEVLSGATTKQETVNGVKTTRYSFDKKALEQLAADLGEGLGDLDTLTDANVDLWLNSDNVPVKILMKMAGTDETGQKMSINLEVNVKDINNSAVQIKPPV